MVEGGRKTVMLLAQKISLKLKAKHFQYRVT